MACGKDLEKEEFEVYYRDGNSENTEAENIDLICTDCDKKLDKSIRGDTEDILEEIEDEMPDASTSEKVLEYLKRSED